MKKKKQKYKKNAEKLSFVLSTVLLMLMVMMMGGPRKGWLTDEYMIISIISTHANKLTGC